MRDEEEKGKKGQADANGNHDEAATEKRAVPVPKQGRSAPNGKNREVLPLTTDPCTGR
jgi:hypothetical protein